MRACWLPRTDHVTPVTETVGVTVASAAPIDGGHACGMGPPRDDPGVPSRRLDRAGGRRPGPADPTARTMIGFPSRSRGRALPHAGRFLNAFVETSIPTLRLLDIASNIGPTVAVSSAATYVYFVFIILSTLRLNPVLCVFTGSAAALESAGRTAWHWDVILGTSGRDPNSAWLVHGMRTVGFLIGGLTAAFVSMQIRRRLLETLRAVEERGEVVEMFGKHVSPEVAETLLARNVRGEGETREVCVMVLDIRGFTTFSEHIPPGPSAHGPEVVRIAAWPR